jgi:RimJ/RimL family protein N-acetyltransferase
LPYDWPDIEFGWVIASQYQGNGLALEAARACCRWIFETTDIRQLIHTIRPNNIASQKIAQGLGSINIGPIQLPAPYDVFPNDKWALTREHFLSRHQ